MSPGRPEERGVDAAIPPLGQREQGPLGELVLCECRWLPSGVSVGSGEASVTLHGQGKAKGGTRAGSIDDPQGRDPRASGPGAPSAAPGVGVETGPWSAWGSELTSQEWSFSWCDTLALLSRSYS